MSQRNVVLFYTRSPYYQEATKSTKLSIQNQASAVVLALSRFVCTTSHREKARAARTPPDPCSQAQISFSLISKTPACSTSWLCHSSHRNGAKGYPGATILPYENDEVAPCSRSDRSTRVHPANLEGRLLGKFEVHQAFLHGSFPK